MARKRKAKRKVPENVYYEIEVEDWEIDYSFGLNTAPRDLIRGVYSEYSTLILAGKILSPTIEHASKARMQISADPQMDDYWAAKPTIISAEAIGMVTLLKEEETLEFMCSIPAMTMPFIAQAAQSKKVRFASVSATKLKWRQASVLRIKLSTNREE